MSRCITIASSITDLKNVMCSQMSHIVFCFKRVFSLIHLMCFMSNVFYRLNIVSHSNEWTPPPHPTQKNKQKNTAPLTENIFSSPRIQVVLFYLLCSKNMDPFADSNQSLF